ncbi:MAG: hypothetical protein U1U88_001349 [Lawsonella clevelandensis]
MPAARPTGNTDGTANTSAMSPSCDRASRGPRGAGSASTGRYRRYSWTSSGPDEWDPQLLTTLIADTVKNTAGRRKSPAAASSTTGRT